MSVLQAAIFRLQPDKVLQGKLDAAETMSDKLNVFDDKMS